MNCSFSYQHKIEKSQIMSIDPLHLVLDNLALFIFIIAILYILWAILRHNLLVQRKYRVQTFISQSTPINNYVKVLNDQNASFKRSDYREKHTFRIKIR